jgi:hypothetical protein
VNGLGAARLVDDLYRRAVEEPTMVDDTVLADWAAQAGELTDQADRAVRRTLRRVVRDARKLARYWGTRDPSSLPDWRNGVDEALGSRGWEPQLDLVAGALEREPSAELFAEMGARHRAVHFRPWMEGVTFEEWLQGSPPP